MTKKHFLASALLAAALLVTSGAMAQTQAGSQSGSVASTENINAPVFNMPATPAATYAKVDSTTNQAASPATVFVNPPAADTCAKAGFGMSAQVAQAGGAISVPGGESVKCDMRADTINLKVTGADPAVIKARHCMDAQMAEAYARAGQPCRDLREGRNAAAAPEPRREQQAAAALPNLLP